MATTNTKQDSPKKQLSNSTKPLHLISLGLVIIALCLSIWTAVDIFLLKSTNQSFNESWINARIELAARSKSLNDTVTQQQQQISRLETQITNLSNADFNSKRSYALHQAGYELQLARLYAHFGNNPQRCLSLLQNARRNIIASNTPELNLLQNNIAKTITDIKAHANDKQTTLKTLDTLASRIAALPTVPVAFKAKQIPKMQAKKINTANHHWYKPLLSLLHGLKSLVVIRHYSTPINPALSQDQRQVIKQTLLLQINLARWAVLTDNAPLYQQSLQAMQKSLGKTFFFTKQSAIDNNTVKALLSHPPAASSSNIDSFNQQLSNYLQHAGSINQQTSKFKLNNIPSSKKVTVK